MKYEPLYKAKQAGREEPSSGRSVLRMIIIASIFAITLATAIVVRSSVGVSDELRRSPGSGGRSAAHSVQDNRGDRLATALASRAQGGNHKAAPADDHRHHEEDEGEDEGEDEEGD